MAFYMLLLFAASIVFAIVPLLVKLMSGTSLLLRILATMAVSIAHSSIDFRLKAAEGTTLSYEFLTGFLGRFFWLPPKEAADLDILWNSPVIIILFFSPVRPQDIAYHGLKPLEG